jgi:lipopolysaccharide export system ATP-binding protein
MQRQKTFPKIKIDPKHHGSSLILKVEGLVKIYGKRRVVDGVGFHVNRGEIVGLLGPNGAGKTTSFRMTCGMIEPNAGMVFLSGQDVTQWPMYRRARDGGMGYLPQDESVFRNLSVQDNLLGVMELLGMDRKTRKRRTEELLEKFKITHLRKNKARSLSGGERRRLEIARSLVSRPEIILLDEPFTGIDPVTIDSIQETIRTLSQDGIAILITDHQVRETLQITHRSYVIKTGKVLCHGTPEEVLANQEAREVYFGEDMDLGALRSAKTTGIPNLEMRSDRGRGLGSGHPVPPPPSTRKTPSRSATSQHRDGLDRREKTAEKPKSKKKSPPSSFFQLDSWFQKK